MFKLLNELREYFLKTTWFELILSKGSDFPYSRRVKPVSFKIYGKDPDALFSQLNNGDAEFDCFARNSMRSSS